MPSLSYTGHAARIQCLLPVDIKVERSCVVSSANGDRFTAASSPLESHTDKSQVMAGGCGGRSSVQAKLQKFAWEHNQGMASKGDDSPPDKQLPSEGKKELML